MRSHLGAVLAVADLTSRQKPALSTLLALLISLIAHLLIIMAFFKVPGEGPSGGGEERSLAPDQAIPDQVIEVELIVMPLPPKTPPVVTVSPPPVSVSSKTIDPVRPEPSSVAENQPPEPDAAKHQAALPDVLDPWWVSPRGESKEARLRRVLTAAACPQFIDPADVVLLERCADARSKQRLGPMVGPVQARLAASMAADIEARAIKRGWATASTPSHPELEIAEREGTLKAPGSEVFGPWPWESRD